ncbi:universal stress protein [Roseovarius aestuariivivens]|uniref:universal stress protein n=1 Tax=Roseovarius aestuariivivens TaxID=1888910 RepID=UPI001081A026|nr:universal stress protein [Roseovarius aestuariivivens]
MTTHVFVATDGSETANKAVDMAADVAAKFGVPLTIGHVLQYGRASEELARMADVEHLVEHVTRKAGFDFANVPDTMLGLFEETRPGNDSVRVITLIGEETLARAADRAKAREAERVTTVSSEGDAADAILDMAADAGADIVVVGHRGLGRLKTALLGSVAHKVVQQAACTVVSVR